MLPGTPVSDNEVSTKETMEESTVTERPVSAEEKPRNGLTASPETLTLPGECGGGRFDAPPTTCRCCSVPDQCTALLLAPTMGLLCVEPSVSRYTFSAQKFEWWLAVKSGLAGLGIQEKLTCKS